MSFSAVVLIVAVLVAATIATKHILNKIKQSIRIKRERKMVACSKHLINRLFPYYFDIHEVASLLIPELQVANKIGYGCLGASEMTTKDEKVLWSHIETLNAGFEGTSLELEISEKRRRKIEEIVFGLFETTRASFELWKEEKPMKGKLGVEKLTVLGKLQSLDSCACRGKLELIQSPEKGLKEESGLFEAFFSFEELVEIEIAKSELIMRGLIRLIASELEVVRISLFGDSGKNGGKSKANTGNFEQYRSLVSSNNIIMVDFDEKDESGKNRLEESDSQISDLSFEVYKRRALIKVVESSSSLVDQIIVKKGNFQIHFGLSTNPLFYYFKAKKRLLEGANEANLDIFNRISDSISEDFMRLYMDVLGVPSPNQDLRRVKAEHGDELLLRMRVFEVDVLQKFQEKIRRPETELAIFGRRKSTQTPLLHREKSLCLSIIKECA